MNTAEMIDALCKHAIRTEMGVQMQMGLPFFLMRGDQLRARFYPHREEITGEDILLYAPAYRVELVYPFRRLCSFENRVLEGVADAGALRLAIDAETYLREYARWMEKLSALSDRILQAAGDGVTVARAIEEYASVLGEALPALNLEDVYPLEEDGIALYRRI